MKHLFTSESVTEGHPDKVCDIISDSILDAYLDKDKNARVAIECLIKSKELIIAGEVTSNALAFVIDEALTALDKIGYDSGSFTIRHLVNRQSRDIAQGVDTGGAGDQGLMFGYATDETKELMPAPIFYAHRLAEQLTNVRKTRQVPFFLPDGKTQLTFEYEDNRPIRVDSIVVSTQHKETASQIDVFDAVCELVIKPIIPEHWIDRKTKYYINPTGRFIIGGPEADCGLTGRKIIVDTYGGAGRHGGGAFSGKDPSKVDRSAAYYARFIAKNLVAKGFAKRCEVQIAYAIGIAEPVSVSVNTFGTGDNEEATKHVLDNYDMRPRSIIRQLDLLRVQYKKTAAYGHFGRSEFPWEKIQ